MEPLAKPAIKCVKEKQTQIIPERFEKVIITGWRTSRIGVFPVSFGGDTEFLLGIVTIAVRLS